MTTNYRVSNLIDRKGNAVQFKDKELRDKVDELKNIASSAVTIAEGAVDTANASAETVTEALSNISAAEAAASGYASAASSSATEASGYVLAASGYATSAASSAASASEYATSAGSSADLAAQSATSAANSAGSATSSASTAATSANAASGSATAAAGSALAADDSATAAAGSATSAASSATDARSYAIGGTGTRTGEDSDNAEYYSDLATDSATAAAGSVLDAEAWAKGTRNGSPVGDTDDTYHANAKYYADAAQDVLDSIPQDYSTMSSDVTGLKSDIEVKGAGKDYQVGLYATTNGAYNSSRSDYICTVTPVAVNGGDTLYIENIPTTATGSLYCIYYDSSMAFKSGVQFYNYFATPTNITVPSGASYVHFDMTIGNTQIDIDACKKIVVYINGSPVYKDAVERIDAKIDNLCTRYNVNLVDFGDSTDGKYINPGTGALSTNANFTAYGFIPVTGGTAYTVSATNAYYGAFYDSSRTFISESGIQQNINGEHTIAYTAPSTAKYLRISCQTAQISTLSVYVASDYNTVLNDEIYVHAENIIPASTDASVVTPSDNLVEVFLNNAGKELYVSTGTYDIIEHYTDYFGDDYFDNYVSYNTTGKIVDAGLPVGRGTIVHFAPDALLTCNYTGNNSAVVNNFCAFALYGDVTLDGLNLTTSGVRDAIHDDFDTNYNGITIIKNCIINSDKRCIAGGMHTGSHYLLENNLFSGSDSSGYDVTYHNRNSASAKNAMVVTGNYFANGISLRYAGTSTAITEILVNNNSMAKAVQHTAESALMTVDNIDIKEWNNVIRS